MSVPRDLQTPSLREDDIARTLIWLADALVTDYDEVELLRDLVDSCVRILDGDAAGISLGAGNRLGFVIATSETMEVGDLGDTLAAQARTSSCRCSTSSDSTRSPTRTRSRCSCPTTTRSPRSTRTSSPG